MLWVEARLRQRRKLEGFRDFLMWAITLLSLSPVTLRISSKVIRSAQAAQIIQSELSLDGSGFLTRVTGLLDCLGLINSRISEKNAVANYVQVGLWWISNCRFVYSNLGLNKRMHILTSYFKKSCIFMDEGSNSGIFDLFGFKFRLYLIINGARILLNAVTVYFWLHKLFCSNFC